MLWGILHERWRQTCAGVEVNEPAKEKKQLARVHIVWEKYAHLYKELLTPPVLMMFLGLISPWTMPAS